MSCINCNCPMCSPRYYIGMENIHRNFAIGSLLVSLETDYTKRLEDLIGCISNTETISLMTGMYPPFKDQPVLQRKTNVSPQKQAHIDHLKKLRKQRW